MNGPLARTARWLPLLVLLVAMPVKPVGAEPSAAVVRGTAFFDQAVRWINGPRAAATPIETFDADLHDVQFDVRGTHQEGYVEIWFEAPDKFRQAWRQTRARTDTTPVTTKILAGDRMWIVGPDQKTRRIHGTAGGAAAVKQLQEDRDRLANLARFVTLGGLRGPDVTFEDLGAVVEVSGPLAGRWARVRRSRPGAADMILYFAHETNAAGHVVRVSYPGVVVVEGDKAAGRPTEAYVLSRWNKAEPFRYPTKVEAYLRDDGEEGAEYARFLLAFPARIRLNEDLPAHLFAPPTG